MSYYSQEDFDEMESVMDDEAVRRRPRRPSPTYNANRRPYAPAPIRPGVAQTGQVSQGFERVGNDVRQLVTQIKEVEARVDASSAQTAKTLRALQADLQQTKMISALLPMLSRPDTVNVTAEVQGIDGLKKGDKLAKAKDDTMSMILPLMMMTGMGGSSESGEGGNNNMMMMMVLAIALSQRPQTQS